jgi:type II secretory pathway pseudopilin PulG
MKHFSTDENGFTLLELVVVIVSIIILAILAYTLIQM